ncbi:immunoglobulin domain-containing protein, partial [Pontibacter aydingkolensis]
TTTGCEGSTRTAVTATINPIPAAPTTTGGSRCGPGDVNLSAAGAPTGGLYRWYDTQTSTTILLEGSSTSVIARNVQATRDFWVSAVDASTGCESERTRVTATINPIPAAPTTTNGSRCGPGDVNLSAAGAPTGGLYRWYDTQTSTTILLESSSTSVIATNVQATRDFWVSAVDASTGCESERTRVTATINPIPAAPTTTNGSRCGPGSVTLSAAGAPAGGTYRWYTVATGGTAITGATSDTYTTPSISATTTYYVSAMSAQNCEGPRTAVTATINPIPAAPTTTGGSRCGPGTVNLSATPGTNGNTTRWYTASSGGSHVHEGTSYTTPSLSSATTYFVSSYSTTTGCESSTRTAVTATINPIPAAPTATGASRCGTGTVTLTAAGAPAGGSYRWYTVATGGTPISGATGSSYTTPSLTQTTTYYVSTVSDLACESSRTAVTATVNQVLAPTATNGSRCGTGTVTLTATPGTNGNIVRWYDASSGGSHFHEGTSYTTPSLSSTTTNFVSSYSTTTGCEGSTRTAVTATINPIPAAPTTTG